MHVNVPFDYTYFSLVILVLHYCEPPGWKHTSKKDTTCTQQQFVNKSSCQLNFEHILLWNDQTLTNYLFRAYFEISVTQKKKKRNKRNKKREKSRLTYHNNRPLCRGNIAINMKRVYYGRPIQRKIYDVPMKFAHKLIHGGPVQHCYELVEALQQCMVLSKKEKRKRKQTLTKFKGRALHWPNFQSDFFPWKSFCKGFFKQPSPTFPFENDLLFFPFPSYLVNPSSTLFSWV